MNSEVFDQSPKSTIRFELRNLRAYGPKALLKILRWPVCLLVDYPVQKLQRRFGKALMELHFVEPMHDSLGVGYSLQPPENLPKCLGECVLRCDTHASEALRD